jgi:hypothetical protein
MRRLYARVVATAVMAATASFGLATAPGSPAAAVACDGPQGVSVVVDRGALGGGISEVCDPAGAGKAAIALFEDAGFSLTYVETQPGAVCQVDGEPASDPCFQAPPPDAHWGLWSSDGISGSWEYASGDPASLAVPGGGYVAFAWQAAADLREPGVPATPHESSPTPEPTPSESPSDGGDGDGDGGSGDDGGKGDDTGTGDDATGGGGASGSLSPSNSASSATSAPGSTTATWYADAGSEPGAGGPPASGVPVPSVSQTGVPATAAGSASVAGSGSAAPEDAFTETAAPSDGDALPVWVVPAVLFVVGVGGGSIIVVRHHKRLGL